MINILTRTSNRPKYFKTCCDSINYQSYKDINHIIGVDDIKSIPYVKEYTSNYIYIDPLKYKHNQNKNFWYNPTNMGDTPAWWNSYFNDMYSLLKPGWVMFLDDDDQFIYENSLEYITSNLINEDSLIFWKVQFLNYTIPRYNTKPLNQFPPTPGNISGIGFMFHTNYIKYAMWEPWGSGDFRVSYNLWQNIPNKIQLNETLTKIQDVPHFGNRQDKL